MMPSYWTTLLLCSLMCPTWTYGIILDDIWERFVKVHQKKYAMEETAFRRLVWEKNVRLIQRHNLEYDLGLHTFTLGLNDRADWSVEEFHHSLMTVGGKQMGHPRNDTRLLFRPSVHDGVPDAVDWREEGYVTSVKHQYDCGACWAFSATGALEGQHFKATGELLDLSQQQLIDCCMTNTGCSGGWMDLAFEYIADEGGLDTDEYYPYQGMETWRCTFNPDYIGATCTGYVDIEQTEDALKIATADIGPISVGIDGSLQSFEFYKSGVYMDSACSSTDMTHAVLVVGYGAENGQDYWLIKNSWGTSWGEAGYGKMARNKNNLCGIASFASYPIV